MKKYVQIHFMLCIMADQRGLLFFLTPA